MRFHSKRFAPPQLAAGCLMLVAGLGGLQGLLQVAEAEAATPTARHVDPRHPEAAHDQEPRVIPMPPAPRSRTRAEAASNGSDEEPAPASELTSSQFREREVTSSLHWDLLRLPEFGTRLLLTPLFPLTTLAEQTRLDLRIYDLVTNEERTSIVLPLVTAYTKDGLGVGLLYSHSDAFGAGENVKFYALTTDNRDVKVSGGYAEDVSVLDGRALGLVFEYQRDKNGRFYGIGPDTEPSHLRALETKGLSVELEVDVGGPNTFFRTGLGSELTLGYLRERHAPGKISGAAPVSSSDTFVMPPPGFEQHLDYARAEWQFSYDQRDTLGRTHEGLYLASVLSATSDLNGADLNAAKAVVSGSYFLPVAPQHRVVVLTLAGATSTPLGEAAEVPLHELVELGRSAHLRGYASHRFHDRAGYWATLEYRYPVFDFQDSGAGMSASLFVDAGAVAPTARELIKTVPRYSPGLGMRAEAPSDFVFRAQIAYSTEGIEAGVSLNEVYDLF